MVSRSGRLNAGTIAAALGVSLALHVGLAALLVVRGPRPPDVERDFAVSVSMAAPALETPSGAAVLPSETAPTTLEAAAAPAEIAAASPSFAAAGQQAAPSTSVTETPQSRPAVSALEGPVAKPADPVAPPVDPAPGAPVAVAAPTAVPLAPPAPALDVAADGAATVVSAMAAVASRGAPAPQMLAAQETIPTSAATVVGTAAAIVAAADLQAPSARVQEGAVGSSRPSMDAAPVTPFGSPTEVTGVVTATLPPREAIVPATGPLEPRSIVTPSLSSSAPVEVAQAAHLPDGALVAHEDTEAERIRKIQTFIDRYDGGACFFMAPAHHVTSDLEIDGLATDRGKIHRFDDGFKTATGSEAKVVVQWISQDQCATVDFLQAARQASQGPTIEIDRRDLRQGDVLSGTIGGAGPEPIRLYWISETGSVDDISERVQDQGERKTFAVPVRRAIDGGPYPQLLVAIIAAGSSNAAGKATKAGDLFAAIEADARKAHRPVSACGRPFRLLP